MTPEEVRALELEQEQAMAMLQMRRHKDAVDARQPDEWYEDLGEGVAVSGMETYYGLKDLVGQMDEEDQATLDDWRQDASESGWGTAGQVVGDIGQMVVPGGAALKGLKAAGKIKNLGRARFLTDLAGGTALGAIQAPTEDESRLGGAMQGAGGAVLGGVLGKAVGKLARGMNVTDDAAQLIDEGVELTPGQASANPMWRGIENVMGLAPGTSSGTNTLRDRALAQWNLKALNAARAPGTKKIETIGYDANKQMAQGFKDGYSDAWAKMGEPPTKDVHNLIRDIASQTRRLDEPSQNVVRNIVDDLAAVTQDYTPEKMRLLDGALRKAINNANNKMNPNPELSKVLKTMRDKLRASGSQEARDQLKNIDEQYKNFLTVRRASASDAAEGAGGTFTPQDLSRASKAIGDEARYFEKAAPMQDVAEQGRATVGRKEPQPIMNVRKALARNWVSPTPLLDFGGRMMLGKTGGQQSLQAMGRSRLADALRRLGISPAKIGAAMTGEDE